MAYAPAYYYVRRTGKFIQMSWGDVRPARIGGEARWRSADTGRDFARVDTDLWGTPLFRRLCGI